MPVPPEETHRFGIIVQDADNKVVQFQEKPSNALSNLASMGIYVFDTAVLLEVLADMAASRGTDFGKHAIPSMLGRYRMYVYPFHGYWRDVGTIDSYFSANMDVLDPGSGIDLLDWRVRTNLAYERVMAMPPASIASGASVADSLVSPGCIVEGEVVRSILSPGVVVENGASVRDSIIMHRSRVERSATVLRAIVDKRCTIGAGARLGTDRPAAPNRASPEHLADGLVVVGRKAVVPPGTAVGGNVIVHPGARGDDFTADTVPDGETVLHAE